MQTGEELADQRSYPYEPKHELHAAPEYLKDRNYQGLGGQLIVSPANLNRPGPIVWRGRLGGLLRFFHREAA